jgi:hypothetical protein
MLGSNLSADSVASTDTGVCYASPVANWPMKLPYRERHQRAKSWGCAGKAPASMCRRPRLTS